MSEFSESYHLRAESQEAAKQLLQKAGVSGYVFPPSNQWVTFVAEDGTFEPNSRIVGRNVGLLVHYVYAEDHGWSFAIFKGHDLVVAYKADWDDELHVDGHAFDEAKFRAVVKEVGGKDPSEWLAIINTRDLETLLGNDPAKVFARTLGLDHFDWLNYDYASQDREDGDEEILEVRA
jgi:hypothetical protein